MTFTIPCQSASHGHKWVPIITQTIQWSKVHGYSKQTLLLATVKIKPLFITYVYASMLACTLHVWTGREHCSSRIIFVSKATASTIPPTQARQRSQNGVSSHTLSSQSPSWSCLWQQPPCVMASVLLAFHNRPRLPELFPSPSDLTAMKEISTHLKESLPALNQAER